MPGQSSNLALGPEAADRILNAMFRGVVATPLSSIYLTLGEGTTVNNAVELTGMTRELQRLNRIMNPSTDNAAPRFYQSTGGGTNSVDIYTETPLLVPSTVTTEKSSNIHAMYYTASTGGALYLVAPVNFSGGNYGALYANDVISANATLQFNTMPSAYIYSMYADYLVRGINSFETIIPVATYPSLYLSFNYGSTDAVANIGMPRLTLPRNTSTWSAPSDYNPGVTYQRKITNLVTLTTSAATSASPAGATTSNAVYTVHLSNVKQSFNDYVYTWTDVNVGQLTWAAGDQISFPPGSIEIVMG